MPSFFEDPTKQLTPAERERARTEQSFCVPKAEIAAQGYDLDFEAIAQRFGVPIRRRQT